MKKQKSANIISLSGKSINWHKTDSQRIRRENALKSRRGNYLKAGRALLALSNLTQDNETQRKAAADARYFFAKHKAVKRGK